MPITILHSGQTGVERGADRAARAVGYDVAGYCTVNGRDELGFIPEDVRASLVAHTRQGARAAAYATVELADAVVIALPDRRDANATTAIEALRRVIKLRGLPHFLVDPASDLDELCLGLRQLEARQDGLRLLVTGPRQTRWAMGERMGWQIVSELSLSKPLVGARKRRVLIVDDHAPTAASMRMLLEVLGHECAAVADGKAALEVAAQIDPDIALIDLCLPDMTGYAVAQELRAQQDRPMFLAAITGWDHGRDPQTALEAGFDRHVLKPAGAYVIQSLLDDANAQLTATAS
ncbi:MAG: response regulator [Kofleriaceae bacterium]